MMTGDQLMQSDNIRRNIDHLTEVANAIDDFRRNPCKETWKIAGKLILRGNKFPSRLGTIGSHAIARSLHSSIVDLKDSEADKFAQLHTRRQTP